MEPIQKMIQATRNQPNELLNVKLKTRMITFDDRMQQVRVVHKASPKDKGYFGFIEFLDYRDDKAYHYILKYRREELKRREDNISQIIRF